MQDTMAHTSAVGPADCEAGASGAMPASGGCGNATATKAATTADANWNIGVAYLFWIAFGFFTGGHWWYLLYLVKENKTRILAAVHAAIYPFNVVLFMVCRLVMVPWSVDCAGGETMSRECLFDEQPTKYQALYVIHIICLVWVFVNWISDGVQLYGHARSAVANAQAHAMTAKGTELGDAGDKQGILADGSPAAGSTPVLTFCCSRSLPAWWDLVLVSGVVTLLVVVWTQVNWSIG